MSRDNIYESSHAFEHAQQFRIFLYILQRDTVSPSHLFLFVLS